MLQIGSTIAPTKMKKKQPPKKRTCLVLVQSLQSKDFLPIFTMEDVVYSYPRRRNSAEIDLRHIGRRNEEMEKNDK